MRRKARMSVLPAGVLAAAVLVLPVAVRSATVSDVQKSLKQFESAYRNALDEHAIVGSSFRFVHDNEILAAYNHGSASLAERRPVDDATIFHWASITKTFTGIAIMQLRDRGLLSLDDPIVKYIPELRDVHNPFGRMEDVSLRHLMSHSAGFRASTWPWGGDKPWHPFEPLYWEQLAAMFPYTEILFPPGSQYSYSNPGIIFLGRVIEELTADDYEVYIDKNILKPLEMYQSYFDATPYHLRKHRAHSYYVKEGAPTPAVVDHNTGITVSNSGLNAPLGDMVEYLGFLMGNPAKQELYDGVLARSSLEDMWEPRMKVPPEGEGGEQAIGLIFFLEQHNGMRFVAHSGNQNAFISHFYLSPESRSAYLVAFNTMPSEAQGGLGDARAADREIRDHLMENVFPLLAGNRSAGER